MTDDLFKEDGAPKRRRQNAAGRTDQSEQTIRWNIRPSERAELTWYDPGPSGKLGGYQRFVNDLIVTLDAHPETTKQRLCIDIDKEAAWRLMRYIQGYGGGGPNGSLRRAFRRFIGTGE